MSKGISPFPFSALLSGISTENSPYGRHAAAAPLPSQREVSTLVLPSNRTGRDMLKAITKRIGEFGVGRTPVGSYFLLAVFAALAIITLAAYWYAVDLVPRWVDKVAFLFVALGAYGKPS
jgi:hypothetical protein